MKHAPEAPRPRAAAVCVWGCIRMNFLDLFRAIFGLAIIQRDGVFIIAGLIGTAICGVYLALVWTTVVAIIHGIAHWVSTLF